MKNITDKFGRPDRISVFSDDAETLRKVVTEFGPPCSTWGVVCQGCWEDFIVFMFENPSVPVDIKCRACEALYYLDCENGVLLDVKRRNSMPAACLVKVALNLEAGAAQDP